MRCYLSGLGIGSPGAQEITTTALIELAIDFEASTGVSLTGWNVTCTRVRRQLHEHAIARKADIFLRLLCKLKCMLGQEFFTRHAKPPFALRLLRLPLAHCVIGRVIFRQPTVVAEFTAKLAEIAHECPLVDPYATCFKIKGKYKWPAGINPVHFQSDLLPNG